MWPPFSFLRRGAAVRRLGRRPASAGPCSDMPWSGIGTRIVMNIAIGALIGLAVLLLIAGGAVWLARRPRRVVASAGFTRSSQPDKDVIELGRRLFGLDVAELLVGDQAGEPSWLVTLVAAGADDVGTSLLVHRFPGTAWPDVAVIRTPPKVPEILRRMMDGGLAHLEPLESALPAGLSGTGWFAYRDPKILVPPPLLFALVGAAQVPEQGALLGLGVTGPYLFILSSSAKTRALLAAGPRIRRLLQETAA